MQKGLKNIYWKKTGKYTKSNLHDSACWKFHFASSWQIGACCAAKKIQRPLCTDQNKRLSRWVLTLYSNWAVYFIIDSAETSCISTLTHGLWICIKIFLILKTIPEAGLGVLLALVAAVQPPVVRDRDDLLAAGRASGGGLRGWCVKEGRSWQRPRERVVKLRFSNPRTPTLIGDTLSRYLSAN